MRSFSTLSRIKKHGGQPVERNTTMCGSVDLERTKFLSPLKVAFLWLLSAATKRCSRRAERPSPCSARDGKCSIAQPRSGPSPRRELLTSPSPSDVWIDCCSRHAKGRSNRR
eukprot:6208077-Pleurochrysis_carterae.AAC.2